MGLVRPVPRPEDRGTAVCYYLGFFGENFLDTASALHALPSSLDGSLFLAVLSIIFIDIILSGDNSVVIAMAVQTLPENLRRKGIIIGTGAAVAMRVGCTFIISHLMQTPLIKFAGGLAILWVAVKLLMENEELRTHKKEAGGLWGAVRIIMIADISMSIDNVLAVAGASKGSSVLLWFGLGLSIPLVIFASSILSRLMQKYPIIVLFGSLLLGKIGGEMMVTDPFLQNWLPHNAWFHHVGAVIGILFVLGMSVWVKRKVAREPDVDEAARQPDADLSRKD
jgi:YjbE family integral membrane protein